MTTIRDSSSQSLGFAVMFVLGVVALVGREVNAFQSIHLMSIPGQRKVDVGRIGINFQDCFHRANSNSLLFASPSDEESDSVEKLFDYDSSNFESEIDDDDLEEIEMGQPPEWMVMQQMLGINSFTVILAVLIVFFLSMNVMLGPGWLGSQLGIPGTGSIQEVSPSLPGSLDLNSPQYQL